MGIPPGGTASTFMDEPEKYTTEITKSTNPNLFCVLS